MSTNNVREKFSAGTAVLGARTKTFATEIVDAYGRLDLDFVWLDLEHSGPSPYDAEALEPLVQAANVVDIELLVRVPTGEDAVIHKVLDTGVQTLLIPRIQTPEEVREAVRATRFTYNGEPGDRGYGGPPPGWDSGTEFTEAADETVVIGVMIEHERAVDNIREILDIPHLGFVFIGANDLSISMGHPGNTGHPEVQEAITTVENAAQKAGVPFGAPYHDTAGAKEALESGYQVLRISDELDAIQTAVGERLSTLRDVT